MKRILLVAIFAATGPYLVTAFLLADLNIAHWDKAVRVETLRDSLAFAVIAAYFFWLGSE